jgi:hypothetical protein
VRHFATLTVVGLLLSVVGASANESQYGDMPAVSSLAVSNAIQLSVDYLERACDANGKFVYRVNSETGRKSSAYNIIRHAGAIYGLATFNHFHSDQQVHAVMIRAGTFMRANYVAPDPSTTSNTNMLVVWSASTGMRKIWEAELGGPALGLVALTEIDQVQHGFCSVDQLEAFGRFLVFLQKEDGSFYCKYRAHSGPVKEWESIYYPGEAALALVSLYELDHSQKWLNAAARALSYLAKTRVDPAKVPDHWVLIATAKFLPYYNQSDCPATQQEFLAHAIQICNVILNEQIITGDQPGLVGGFDPAGRTTPTAIRLEGLLAALEFLPKDRADLRSRIEEAACRGVNFLLRAQIKTGPYAGGMPRSIIKSTTTAPAGTGNPDSRASEVRIDYVQHALCALLRYQELILDQSGSHVLKR